MAIVKGLVEHDQGDAYFGSLMGYTRHFDAAVKAGWVVREGNTELVTIEGRMIYTALKLDTLPNQLGRRAYMWDWSVIPTFTEE